MKSLQKAKRRHHRREHRLSWQGQAVELLHAADALRARLIPGVCARHGTERAR